MGFATLAELRKKPSPMSSTNVPKPLYLAGPIRGIENFRDRFHYTTTILRGEGFKVFNPVEQDDFIEQHGTPVNIEVCLELDLSWICRYSRVVALMKGWENSSGALAEFYTAKALGREIWELPDAYQL